MVPSGLYARLCHAFLVVNVEVTFELFLYSYRSFRH